MRNPYPFLKVLPLLVTSMGTPMFVISKAKVPPGFPKLGRQVSETTLELEQTAIKETKKLIRGLKVRKPRIEVLEKCPIHNCYRTACGCPKEAI